MTENGTQTLELAHCVCLHFAEHFGHSLALSDAHCDFILYCWVSAKHTCETISITTRHHAIYSDELIFLVAFQNTHRNILETSRRRATLDFWPIGKIGDQ